MKLPSALPPEKARIEVIPLLDTMFVLLASLTLVGISTVKSQVIDAGSSQKAKAADTTGRAPSDGASGLVRVTTGWNGRVIKVEIVKSVGNSLLDHNTQTWALQNWSGPPHSTTLIPITYRLQPSSTSNKK